MGYAAALVVAALLHVALVPLLDALPPHAFGGSAPASAAVGQRARPRMKALEVEIRRTASAAKPPPLHEDDPIAPGQVVRLPPTVDEVQPERADYAADVAHRVERETRARVQGTAAPQDGGRATRRLTAPVAEAERLAVAQPLARSGGSVSAGARGAGRAESGASGSDGSNGGGRPLFELALPRARAPTPRGLQPAPDGTLTPAVGAVQPSVGDANAARIALGLEPLAGRRPGTGEPTESRGAAGGGDGSAGLPSLEALTPSAALLARAGGLAANDDLPNVEVDAATRLNAWRWKHSQFFNRMSDALNRTWRRGDPLRDADPTGQRYGFEDRLTVLSVTLDRRGEIVSVNLAEPSGVVALDDDAIATFRRAAPFANPPDALFRGAETFTFQFGFSVGYDRSHIDFDWRAN